METKDDKKSISHFTIGFSCDCLKLGKKKWCCRIREELRESLRWYRESPDYYFPQLGGHSQRRQSGEKEKCCSNFSVNFNMFYFFYIFEYFSARRGSREKKRNTAATFQRPKITIIKHRLKNVCHTVYILIINNPFGMEAERSVWKVQNPRMSKSWLSPKAY